MGFGRGAEASQQSLVGDPVLTVAGFGENTALPKKNGRHGSVSLLSNAKVRFQGIWMRPESSQRI